MKAKLITVLALSLGITACGGGGGGGGGSTPSVNTGAGGDTTTKPAVSSSSSITAVSSSSIVVSSSSSSSIAATPIAVEPTSYLNELKIGNPNQNKTFLMKADDGRSTRLLAYFDFMQDGSTVALSVDYLPNGPIEQWTDATWPVGNLYFFKQSGNSWVNVTDKLLKDRTGCKHVRKANIADFNGDKRPDIFLGCHGSDVMGSTGEKQRILLSQADGTYTNVELSLQCYCHASAAGDINCDGYVDVVLYDTTMTSTSGKPQHPIALLGDGHGGFTEDLTRFADAMIGRPIFTLELVDLGNGTLDILAGGVGFKPGWDGCDCFFENSIIRNDGTGKFTKIEAIDNSLSPTGAFYDLALDFVVKDGYLYMGQVGNQYYSSIVRKVDLSDLSKSTVLTETIHPFGQGAGPWFPWLAVLDNGNITTMCDFSDTTSSWCNWTGI